MVKSSNGGSKKRTNGEAAAKTSAARRRTATKTDVVTASAAEMAAGGSIAQPVDPGPSNEEIAHLAYELYLERGGASGSHLEDWYEAERRLKGRR